MRPSRVLPGRRIARSWTRPSPATSTRRPISSPQSPTCPTAWMSPEPPPELRVVAIDGIPELRPGDDLGGLLAGALASASAVLPLQTDDVLVVTQKVVSKAEGAVVDLRTVTPRDEAVEFARRFD